MKMGASKLTIFLISVIILLLAILGYGVYTGLKVKAEINLLNNQINQLNGDKETLTYQLDLIQKKYELLTQDVAEIYKTCIKENKCRGRYPGVRWYCNNVGDEVTDYSHTCICDASCNLNATEIKR